MKGILHLPCTWQLHLAVPKGACSGNLKSRLIEVVSQDPQGSFN